MGNNMHTFTYLTTEDDGVELSIHTRELKDMAMDVMLEKLREIDLTDFLKELFDGARWQEVEQDLIQGDNSAVISKMIDHPVVIDRCEREAIEEYKSGLGE